MHEKILIKKMEDGYLFYIKNGIIESVKVPAYGKLTLVYQHGKVCYVEKAETTEDVPFREDCIGFMRVHSRFFD